MSRSWYLQSKIRRLSKYDNDGPLAIMSSFEGVSYWIIYIFSVQITCARVASSRRLVNWSEVRKKIAKKIGKTCCEKKQLFCVCFSRSFSRCAPTYYSERFEESSTTATLPDFFFSGRGRCDTGRWKYTWDNFDFQAETLKIRRNDLAVHVICLLRVTALWLCRSGDSQVMFKADIQRRMQIKP